MIKLSKIQRMLGKKRYQLICPKCGSPTLVVTDDRRVEATAKCCVCKSVVDIMVDCQWGFER
jgi:transcription elongation factor Elf1